MENTAAADKVMNRAQPLALALLTHTGLKFNVSGTSLYLTTRGAGRVGAGMRGREGMTCRNTVQPRVPPAVGQPTPRGRALQRQREGNMHATPSFLL